MAKNFFKRAAIAMLFIVVGMTCAGCSLSLSTEQPDWLKQKLCDHIFDEEEILREPTCEKDGKTEKICSDCGFTKIVSIAKLKEHCDKNHDAICDDCGSETKTRLFIGQDNVMDLLSINGDEYVALIEDIDLTGVAWNGDITFKGIFEGNNHTISNLTASQGNAFFKSANAAIIQNVAFTNVCLEQSAAVIAYQPAGPMDIRNVFIGVSSTTSGGRVGAICERSNLSVAINLKDVVIMMPNTNSNEAIFGYTLKGRSGLTNVHCIGLPNEQESVHNTGSLMAYGEYTFWNSVSDMLDADVSVADFIQVILERELIKAQA